MALDHAALLEVLEVMKTAGVDDRVKVAAQTIYQGLIDAELTSVIGAGRWEHNAGRTGVRNGYRPRLLSTPGRGFGVVDPEVADWVVLPLAAGTAPAGRPGAVRGGDGGLPARGVDPQGRRPGDGLGHRLGDLEVGGVADLRDLDVEVGAFRDRTLAETAYPYVFLDATYCKARVNHRVVSQAVVIATGVTGDGRRKVLGFEVGDSEDGAFWTAFLRSLKARGLGGVQLVISDAHTGLTQAVGAVMLGAAWQRCRVHFMRNVLAQVPGGNTEMVAAAVRTVFAQPDAEHVHEQFETIAMMLGRQLPTVEAMMRAARDDLLAFTGFPQAHWRTIWSTNPFKRVNREVKRRTEVVGVFPNPAALLRLSGAVLVEIHDEWAVASERRYLSEASMKLITNPPAQPQEVAEPAALTA